LERSGTIARNPVVGGDGLGIHVLAAQVGRLPEGSGDPPGQLLLCGLGHGRIVGVLERRRPLAGQVLLERHDAEEQVAGRLVRRA